MGHCDEESEGGRQIQFVEVLVAVMMAMKEMLA